MKSPEKAQSTTSIPRAPQDEAAARFTKYAITMGIRIACFILMAAVQPFGWYTWVFAAGAIFLPYVAVVLANVGMDATATRAVDPERQLASVPEPTRVVTDEPSPGIVRIAETPVRRDSPDS